MASSRTLLKPSKHPSKGFTKRRDRPTEPEKALVAAFVADQPGGLTPQQERGLARTLRRSPAVVKQLVETARENFVSSAEEYVDIHMKAARAALANGDPKSLDVAAKSAQWALTNIGAEGARIVDKQSAEAGGSRVMIGIQVGGIDTPVIAVKSVPGE